ncbi:hypothetical protein KCU65_g115, partial [Aureobasidium melanogenum]
LTKHVSRRKIREVHDQRHGLKNAVDLVVSKTLWRNLRRLRSYLNHVYYHLPLKDTYQKNIEDMHVYIYDYLRLSRGSNACRDLLLSGHPPNIHDSNLCVSSELPGDPIAHTFHVDHAKHVSSIVTTALQVSTCPGQTDEKS